MKKLLTIFCVLALSVTVLCGCGEKPELNEEALKPYYNSAWTRVKKEEIAKGMDDANNAYL